MTKFAGLLRRFTDRSFAEVLAAAEGAIFCGNAKVIARIDHSAAAAEAGLELRETTLLIFGNPAGGTRLMQALPESAIDLPMKLLIVAADDRCVQLLGEDPAWIAERHGDAGAMSNVVRSMQQLMQSVLDIAAGVLPQKN